MAQRPTLMVMQPHLAGVAAALEADAQVLRAWDDPPAEATEAVQALVVAGEFPLDKALVARLPRLGLIACFTSGYDGVDVDWVRSRGLQICHALAVNHEDVADHAMGLILAHQRRIVSGDRTVRDGGWTVTAKTLTPSLAGKRVGIVGLGGIGEALARRCEVMRMTVGWWGPRDKPGAAWPRADSLLHLAQDSDVLAVCCRAHDDNRQLISAAVIEALGADGLLVNVARGQLVDEDALIAALKAGRLGGAALDVFVEEPAAPARWADVPNTVLTPHTAGATTASVRAMMGLLHANLAAFFEGRPLKTPVEA